MDELQQAMNKAKIALMSREDSAFFTTVCFSLKHIWDNTIPTSSNQWQGYQVQSRFLYGFEYRRESFFFSMNPCMSLSCTWIGLQHEIEPSGILLQTM